VAKGRRRYAPGRQRAGARQGLPVELPVGGRCSGSWNLALFTEAGENDLDRPVRYSVARRRTEWAATGYQRFQPLLDRAREDNARCRRRVSWPKRVERRETRSSSASGGFLQASRLSHVTRVLVFEMWVAAVGPKHLWVLGVRSKDRATGSLARLEPRRPLTRRRGASRVNGCTKLHFSCG
jgi:hypothetical protein